MLIPNHIYYVTGGTSGLGLASVELLHSLLAYVVILDLPSSASAGEALVKELGGERAMFVECDVRDEDGVKGAIEMVEKRWGEGGLGREVGGLVHCAGIGMAGKVVGNDGNPFSLDVFRETIDINLTGTFLLCSQIASLLIRRTTAPLRSVSPVDTPDRGVLILISSTSYEEGQMGQVAYAASKGGVAGMVLPMARDLARWGVRVVGVAPSLFETSMGRNTGEKAKQSLLQSTLFPARFGKSEEFAHLVVSIIQNQMLNGSMIRLDGGSRMTKM